MSRTDLSNTHSHPYHTNSSYIPINHDRPNNSPDSPNSPGDNVPHSSLEADNTSNPSNPSNPDNPNNLNTNDEMNEINQTVPVGGAVLDIAKHPNNPINPNTCAVQPVSSSPSTQPSNNPNNPPVSNPNSPNNSSDNPNNSAKDTEMVGKIEKISILQCFRVFLNFFQSQEIRKEIPVVSIPYLPSYHSHIYTYTYIMSNALGILGLFKG